MEIKIALTRVLKRFTIKECEKTQVPLPVNTANIQSPSQGVYVKLVPRQLWDLQVKKALIHARDY